MRSWSASKSSPPSRCDHELAVERAAARELRGERRAQLGEVAVERLRVAALEQQLVAVAEHEHAKAVPLRLEDPVRAVGQRGDALGEHRQDGRVDGELHAGILLRVSHRVFLLSPASCAGKRCAQLVARGADFELAVRVRDGGAPIGEVFSFLSSLYFRGKLAYARRFAAPPAGCPGVLVITAGRGLVPPETAITIARRARVQRACRSTRASAAMPQPLRDDARGSARARSGGHRDRAARQHRDAQVRRRAGRGVRPSRSLFPGDFVGRGDMSRGGLLLRAARAASSSATRRSTARERHGRRPAKLPRCRAQRAVGGFTPYDRRAQRCAQRESGSSARHSSRPAAVVA